MARKTTVSTLTRIMMTIKIIKVYRYCVYCYDYNYKKNDNAVIDNTDNRMTFAITMLHKANENSDDMNTYDNNTANSNDINNNCYGSYCFNYRPTILMVISTRNRIYSNINGNDTCKRC